MIDPTTIIRGPAVIQTSTAVIYTAEDISVTTEVAMTDGRNSIHGLYNRFHDSVMYKISFTPAPQVTAAIISELFPYQSVAIGASIFSSAADLTIWSVDGKQYTYKYAALTKMPDLNLSAGAPIFDGTAEYTALGDPTEDWPTEGHFESMVAAAFTDTSFDRTKDIRLHYSVAWGMGGNWADMETESGVKFSAELSLSNVLDDQMGIVDMTITDLTASATFTPRGITAEDLYVARGLQQSTSRRGMPVSSVCSSLTVNTVIGEPMLVLNSAYLDESNVGFGAETNRIGEVKLTSMSGSQALLLHPFSFGLMAAG